MEVTPPAVARLAGERVDHRFKGLPPDAEGYTFGQLAAERRPLFTGGFTTPLLTLDSAALDHNLARLAGFTARHGLAFAPHGKTSMAPQLFARQLALGAWGITAATPAQVRVCRAFGVPRVFLANEVVDATALAWLSAELAADPGFRVIVYVDSVRGVELMDAALTHPLDVVVELGVAGGRTGVRDQATADQVADAVAASRHLRLTGVAGYEGGIPDRTPQTVRAWLDRLVGLARRFDAAGRFAGADEIVVSAGGSAWFDVVAEAFAAADGFSLPSLKLLRSGAYVTHDDGHYRQVTPYHHRLPEDGLRSALLLWAQVVSRPEPGRAYLNAGKRDLPHDLDLPLPRLIRSPDSPTPRPATGLTVTALADQHTFLSLAPTTPLDIGDWVALGISHPCTAFDKWQAIPLVDADHAVTDYVRTFF
ncbi:MULTISPECIES: alanine racemase [Streptomycetaceae]|uniref:alanine racemase n=1 Tax=Streptomycetaceae TaxID=2062 RepID=UPI000213FE75|nr:MULTISPECIES: alanine racemase [Streptomycetaceae]CCB76564.1 putative D-amino acid deaminase [Streptantibioticus cattleyicolor NRRL 8057 = DSM 46488]